jgi:hypothetical protein
MAEMTVSTLIKMILGIIVVASLIYGLYYVFRHKILDFFTGFTGEPVQVVRFLVNEFVGL